MEWLAPREVRCAEPSVGGKRHDGPMQKIDVKTERKDLYAPSAEHFAIVEIPTFSFLMIDGHGNPNTEPSYALAVEALYAASYAAKFTSKAEGRDYVVAPLEGLWYADRLEAFTDRSKDEWSWTMMIRQPDWLTDEKWDAALAKAATKSDITGLRLQSLAEGRAVQILHVGSYDEEAPTVARMHEFIAGNGLIETGHHHEIYLGDPRRVEPAKLKTILRQPVA
jgi:hypothetical protein